MYHKAPALCVTAALSHLNDDSGCEPTEVIPHTSILAFVHFHSFISDMPLFTDVPLDILGQIFTAWHQDAYSQSRPSPPWPEVTLSHVCRQWRNLALSSHFKNLWNIIIYDYWRLHDLERVKTYLERSAPLPIQVTLKILKKKSHRVEDFLGDELLNLVCDEVARWKTFTPGGLEIDDDPGASFTPRFLTGSAPRLIAVSLTDIGVQLFLPPLNHVVELSLEGTGGAKLVGWDDFITIVLQLPTLRRLSAMGDILPGFDVDVRVTGGLHGSTIEAPYITHFRYDGGYDPEEETILTGLLYRLSAPNLECLMLGNIDEDKSFGAAVNDSNPSSGSRAVFPKLKTVLLYGCSIWHVDADAEEQWYAWLSRAAPGLETLKIAGSEGRGSSILNHRNIFSGIQELVYFPWSLASNVTWTNAEKDAVMAETMKLLVEFSSARQSLRTIVVPSMVINAAGLEGPWKEPYGILEASVDIKTFGTLWEVVPEAFVFRSTLSSFASEGPDWLLSHWKESAEEFEVGGKSIEGSVLATMSGLTLLRPDIVRNFDQGNYVLTSLVYIQFTGSAYSSVDCSDEKRPCFYHLCTSILDQPERVFELPFNSIDEVQQNGGPAATELHETLRKAADNVHAALRKIRNTDALQVGLEVRKALDNTCTRLYDLMIMCL
ncbi:hypothetical protein BKA70DRAFT_1451705 [Coprinopsis sp. MPI-PUGE-AT-0042]|nr:hypothetical protein BKA70DRAFT_1451705 [Coprinopsis sp. MPI-PUGE-AT-0042]